MPDEVCIITPYVTKSLLSDLLFSTINSVLTFLPYQK